MRLTWLAALACATLSPAGARAQAHGTIRIDSVASRALGVSRRFVVYLPPSYAHAATRRYPVAYFLHGTGGDERSWPIGLALPAALDSLASAGVPEMIVVMPDGDLGYYHDWVSAPDYDACLAHPTPTGEPPASYCVRARRYGEYVARDLVARVDSIYRTMPDAQHRGVAGFSMGGYGAVYLPLAYPDVFAAGASFSGAALSLLRVDATPAVPAHAAHDSAELHRVWGRSWDEMIEELGGDIANWRAHDPVSLVHAMAAAHRAIPALWLVVGTDDPNVTVNRALHATLDSLGVTHAYSEAPGGHTAVFWIEHEADGAAWLARVLTQNAPR